MSENVEKIDDGTLKGDELDHALAAAKGENGNYTHKFQKTLLWEKREYTELYFDFMKLKVGTMIDIVRELAITRSVTVVDPALSGIFLMVMAAKAAGVGYDMIEKLPISDAYQIREKAKSFLMRMPSEAFLEMNFEFEKLTASDMISFEQQIIVKEGVTVVNPGMSAMFLMAMAAKASNKDYDDIKELPIYDGAPILRKARSFLMQPVV